MFKSAQPIIATLVVDGKPLQFSGIFECYGPMIEKECSVLIPKSDGSGNIRKYIQLADKDGKPNVTAVPEKPDPINEASPITPMK